MSAKGRGTASTPFDYHPTPAWPVHRLLEYLTSSTELRTETITNLRVLEPCAGDGAIIRACKSWSKGLSQLWGWGAMEIQERFRSSLEDATGIENVMIGNSLNFNLKPAAELIITNPPFALARQFIDCFSYVPVSFWLLRVGFNSTPERVPWLRKLKPNIYQLPNRPAFTLNKDGKLSTDASEYAWFEFGKYAAGKIHYLDITPKAELIRAREEQRELLKKWAA